MQVVDLSHTVYTGMPHWATHRDPLISRAKWLERDGYDMSIIEGMTTHTGTHVDAPSHFSPGGKTVDRLPLSKFVGEGVVLDLRWKKAGEEITEEDVQGADKKIRRGDVVLLCTGWSKKRGFTREYLYEWPYVGAAAAKHFVNLNIKAIGIDGLSIGGWGESVPVQGPSAKTPPSQSHRIFLESEVVIIEELANLEVVIERSTDGRALFSYAPLYFVDAEAAPCRAYAIID